MTYHGCDFELHHSGILILFGIPQHSVIVLNVILGTKAVQVVAVSNRKVVQVIQDIVLLQCCQFGVDMLTQLGFSLNHFGAVVVSKAEAGTRCIRCILVPRRIIVVVGVQLIRTLSLSVVSPFFFFFAFFLSV